MNTLLRHIAACNTARLPGERVAFRIGPSVVGWVRPDLAAALAAFATITVTSAAVTLAADAAGELPAIARALTGRGFGRWRNEAFDVREVPGGPVLSQIDRGALPVFGIQAEGVHVNGLVRRGDGLYLWIARRAADKALDPGKLDHIVAGGIPAGMTPAQTLVKEAAEEAAIPAAIASRAVKRAEIAYAMERPEGLRRDLLHCYDLELPQDFTPRAADGEVESFTLAPAADVLAIMRDSENFKFNVNLVLIDLFLRLGTIAGAEADALRRALAKPSG
jgi:8-oxo-dGTP pyrophosphatase MutT (NUDIX family)